jgi:dTDP-4-dehydrorhamnose reductase
MRRSTVLIAGAAGQLGRELLRAAWPADTCVIGLGRAQLDLTDADKVREAVAAARPATIVNAAAYTDVDRAEREVSLAQAVNRDGVVNLVAAAEEAGARLVHISTDYVFDGRKAGWYVEADPVAPISVYGRTKAAGEEAARRLERHLILRTAALFGSQGSNFVTKILAAARQRSSVQIVDDQKTCPSSARDVAAAIVRLVTDETASALTGTFHLAGPTSATWFEFATEALAPQVAAGAVTVDPVTSDEFAALAPRPADSRLDSTALREATGIALRSWREALPDVLRELEPAGAEPPHRRSS